MTCEAMLDQALATLQRRSGVTYRVLLRLLDHQRAHPARQRRGRSGTGVAREAARPVPYAGPVTSRRRAAGAGRSGASDR